ncbi:hypothetical protein R1sor_019599 [Riccia sorocarpa]|uniref:Uncharacterized protein n=1 Tax=Riccia sorocarpa TaxID=122646 RepID=A0ABD3IH97_9MARC
MEANCGWEFHCKEEMEDTIKLVVDRSHGQLRCLRTMFCSNEPLLIELSIIESFYVEDESALVLAENCRRSSGAFITREFSGIDLPDGDQEAVAISYYMPGLKHLELKRSNSLTD